MKVKNNVMDLKKNTENIYHNWDFIDNIFSLNLIFATKWLVCGN